MLWSHIRSIRAKHTKFYVTLQSGKILILFLILWIVLLQCSAAYCGDYRFKLKNDSLTYRTHPDLIKTIQEAEVNEGGEFECFLNPKEPKNGAYLHLNEKVDSADKRIFRWYEGWLILMTLLAISLAVLIYLCVVFFQGRLAGSNTTQRQKGTFGKHALHSQVQPWNAGMEICVFVDIHIFSTKTVFGLTKYAVGSVGILFSCRKKLCQKKSKRTFKQSLSLEHPICFVLAGAERYR